MFKDVLSESTDRILQSTAILHQIKEIESAPVKSIVDLNRIQKGMLFVTLYASIEYTVTNCCFNFLTILQSKEYIPSQYKDNLLCVILDSNFKSVIDSGKKTVWKRKSELIESVFSANKTTIDNTVMPINGFNIGITELKDVWSFFHIPEPVIPDEENSWYLNEIKGHRNAIAHGREKATEIGKRYTFVELEKRHNFVSMLCSHIVSAFDSHTKNESYLKNTA